MKQLLHKTGVIAAISALCFATGLHAQTAPQGAGNAAAATRSILSTPYSPLANPGDAFSLWTNPAGIGLNHKSTFSFFKPSSSDDYEKFYGRDFGVGFTFASGLGFGYQETNDASVRLYSLGLGGEVINGVDFGLAYHWNKGLAKESSVDLGLLVRPTSWLSVGATMLDAIGGEYDATNEIDPTYKLGVAFRPLGYRLTLSGDVTLWKGNGNDYGNEIDPTFSVDVEPWNGIHIRGGYGLDSEYAFAGLALDFGQLTIGQHTAMPVDNDALSDRGAGWVTFASDYSPSVLNFMKPKTVVHLKWNGMVDEEEAGFPASLFAPSGQTVLQIIQQLDNIAEDDRVKGIYIEIEGMACGFSDRVEIRQALQRVQKSGKKIAVYAQNYTLGNFFVASVADEIWMYPAGNVLIPGFNLEGMYYKRLLDKLQIEAQFVNVGKYKSAAEGYTRSGMSEPAREARESLLEAIWTEYTGSIADGRDESTDTVEKWIDEALITAKKAQKLHLIDKLTYPDEIKKNVKELFGKGSTLMPEMVYNQTPYSARGDWDHLGNKRIAIVYATGTIMDGESSYNLFKGTRTMGGETIARAIRNARNNPFVDAIVLRVDSPGGSALASDVIAREVKLTVDESFEDERHIPVIVSMSDVAASGGYYISAMADTIFAEKTCITGSIGVIGGHMVIEGLLDTLGVDLDGVKRGKNADIFSYHRWNEEQEAIMRNMMKDTYEDFKGVVAEGRGMSVEDVHKIGQGRVWAGTDAKEIGLIDEFGGFYEAINLAREMVGAKKSEVVDLQLYYAIDSMPIMTQAKMLIMGTLPESLRQAMELEAKIQEDQEPKAEMRLPIDQKDLILK